jgi:hypothetical protein
MIKMLIVFISLFVIIFTSVDIFRRLTGKEKIQFLSLAGYSLAIAAITSLLALAIIVLF